MGRYLSLTAAGAAADAGSGSRARNRKSNAGRNCDAGRNRGDLLYGPRGERHALAGAFER